MQEVDGLERDVLIRIVGDRPGLCVHAGFRGTYRCRERQVGIEFTKIGDAEQRSERRE